MQLQITKTSRADKAHFAAPRHSPTSSSPLLLDGSVSRAFLPGLLVVETVEIIGVSGEETLQR